MAGVYNRKLFRQASARDELRKIGGIMASSEDLLMEAIRTAEQAPRSAALGPMAMPSQAPAPMPMAQPMMQQPMMAPAPMPMAPMQQPMMQQPMQPAFMPPMMPQSAQPMQQPMMQQPMQQPMQQAPVVGFNEGGPVRTLGTEQGGFGGRFGGGFMPPMAIPGGATTVPSPSEGYETEELNDPYFTLAESGRTVPVDVSKTAGTAVEAPVIDDAAYKMAEELAARVDTDPPETTGTKIVEEAAARGMQPTGDLQTDLATIYENLTGDVTAYEKNIDALNRGIIGAAIGAGTSARATENISKGLLVGLEAAKETEERRVRDARALQLAQLQARAKGAGGVGSRDYRNPVDAYQDAYQSVMNAGEFDLQIPEGMTREEYADQVATALIARSYSPEQLVGTPFEGVAGTGRTAPAAGGQGLTPEQQAVLGQARDAIAEGRDPVGVAAKLREMGIDPGLL